MTTELSRNELLDQWYEVEVGKKEPNPDQIRSLDKLAVSAHDNQKRMQTLQRQLFEAQQRNESKANLEELQARIRVRQIRSARFIRRREYLRQQQEARTAAELDSSDGKKNGSLFEECRKAHKALMVLLDQTSRVRAQVGRTDRNSAEFRDFLSMERCLSGAVEILSRVPKK